MMTTSQLQQTLTEFISQLRQAGGNLGLWNDGTKLVSSQSQFQWLADAISQLPDFRNHQAAFFEVGPKTGHLHSVFLHRTERGPGAGGVRRIAYPNLLEMINDGLRLAIGMGCKNALAGLWWGGGKGVIGCPDGSSHMREEVYREFGLFLSRLNGCYVTAEDVGTKPQDMATIFSTTRFTTCIPAEFGGSGNPSPATARGVFVGIEAALRSLGISSMEGVTVALQGLGEVGSRLAAQLHEAGVNLVVFDPEEEKVQNVLSLSQRHRASTAEGILEEEAVVLSPCALGAILNPQTIPKLNCKVICGAANNQLAEESRDSKLIHERGVIFVPDFVVNRMGIVNCADEQYGRLLPDPAIERHLGWDWEHAIAPVVQRLLADSKSSGRPPLEAAAERAEALMEEKHPIWPGRARQIAQEVWQRMSEERFSKGARTTEPTLGEQSE